MVKATVCKIVIPGSSPGAASIAARGPRGGTCCPLSPRDVQLHAPGRLLLAAAIVVALLANFFLMPALILTFEPFGPVRGGADRAAVEAGQSR